MKNFLVRVIYLFAGMILGAGCVYKVILDMLNNSEWCCKNKYIPKVAGTDYTSKYKRWDQ